MKHDRCLDCGIPALVATLSRRGLCVHCSAKRVAQAARQLMEKRGPDYEKSLVQRGPVHVLKDRS